MTAASSVDEARPASGERTPEGRQPQLPFDAAATAAEAGHGSGHAESSRLDNRVGSTDPVWRAADQEAGDLLVFCPACWPEVASQIQGRSGVTVRVLGSRPAWAHCAACEPEEVC